MNWQTCKCCWPDAVLGSWAPAARGKVWTEMGLEHRCHLRQELSVPICPSGFTPSLQPIHYCTFGFVPWSQSPFLLVPDRLSQGLAQNQ